MSTDLSTTNETETGIANVASGRFATIEKFTQLLNKAPRPDQLQPTPDGNGQTMVISSVEATLDELFLRQWGDDITGVLQLGNEVLMWISLWVIDPITQLKITRSGAAAVQITVDKVPDDVKRDPKAKNAWSLDMQNKKPNAMYLAFPKLLSMCRKNAAKTICEALGRNLNRKFEDTPEEYYTNLASGLATLTDALKDIDNARTKPDFDEIWAKYPELQSEEKFKKEFLYYHRKYVK